MKRACELKANLRLCIDGAHRQGGQSAAGIVVIAYYPRAQHCELLLGAGRLLGQLESSFVAELLALECGLDTVSEILDGSTFE